MARIITEFYHSSAPIGGLREQHQHNVYQVLIVTRGYVKCEIAGQDVVCRAPGMIFIGNFEPHMFTAASDDYERYVITITPSVFADKITPKILQTVLSIHPLGFIHSLDLEPIYSDVSYIVKMMYGEWAREGQDSDEGVRVWLDALLLLLYRFAPRLFSSASVSAEKIISAVRTELENDPARKLSLDALAAKHFISRYYLAHIFKQVTGYSIKEYLLLCRISLAGEMLTMTSKPIYSISNECGFADMSNFSRYFRKVTGMTPSAYRKNAQKSQQQK